MRERAKASATMALPLYDSKRILQEVKHFQIALIRGFQSTDGPIKAHLAKSSKQKASVNSRSFKRRSKAASVDVKLSGSYSNPPLVSTSAFVTFHRDLRAHKLSPPV